jgi:hypothetical protein
MFRHTSKKRRLRGARRAVVPSALRVTTIASQRLANALFGDWLSRQRTLVLVSPQSRAIIGSLDTLVDIGVPAEKEVIR